MRDFGFRDIPSLRARAHEYLDADPQTRQIQEPRRAATVMLLRQRDTTARSHREGFDVFVMRRVAAMEFAPGSVVFPGGAVDDADALEPPLGIDPALPWAGPSAALPWAGPSPAQWAQRLGCDAALAAMWVVAAVREVFEECGVLLAGRDASGPLYDVDLAEHRWGSARLALLARTRTLADILTHEGLVLRSDALAPVARWVTPEFESRRYDTVFFLARMPAGQEAHHVSTEADRAMWVDPAHVLADHAAGHVTLLPPTVIWLEALAALTHPADLDALVERADLRPIQPHVHQHPDGRLVIRV